MSSSLAAQIDTVPKLGDAKEAARKLASFVEKAIDDGMGERLKTCLTEFPKAEALLEGIADHSPYLWRLIQSDPIRTLALLEGDPDITSAELLERTAGSWRVAESEATLMRALRQLKQEAALFIGLADIGGLWGVLRVTEALSDFADAALGSAFRFLLREGMESGKLVAPDPEDPAIGCGAVVLALGKHGARELNYSSDIDIVVFYDTEQNSLGESVEAAPFFIRLVKGIVRILQERTPDGYVLRVDLRLRPDPASTPIAISVNSAFAYYESVGQNWERAALIKARPVAGDLPVGERFLADLAPFIWRKYFDFAAIADIHAMKRQIHAVRGHDAIAVAGHDIKLGRGGIREIEFFVQTQQLVFGGRRPGLRGRRTLEMLQALVADGWISSDALSDLTRAYVFLRTVEHRLQMVADEQTQRLPADEKHLTQFAKFCGYSGLAAFSKALTDKARLVEKHYSRLFEEGADLATGEGSLVFTGTTDDPETIETLRRMGFSEPERAAETVRGWHFGRRAAVTSARAREALTELVPRLLESFGRSADPDGAMATFDRVLGGMPAAGELFSILREHKAILTLFAAILGSAPRLAEIVANRPHLLDAIIDPAFIEPFPTLPVLLTRISDAVGQNELYEDFLDRLREAGQHELFLVGARALSGALSPAMAGESYSLIAEAILHIALGEVERRFAADHGRIAGGRITVLGMGRLGSREMTATSDLDLIVLYDFADGSPESDGARPLDPVVYYGRLTQRLISALTVPTRRGTLYAVDMRLRPSGNKGPAATQYKGFLSYHQSAEAETWEHLALVRARVVAGDPAFMDEVSTAIHAILCRPRERKTVFVDAVLMREMIAREKGDAEIWDLKLARGGLLDIEFLSQALVLAESQRHPQLAVPGTEAILQQAVKLKILNETEGDTLKTAYAMMRDLFQWQRLTLTEAFDPKTASATFKKRLATLAGLPDFKVLASHLSETMGEVRVIFERVLGGK